MLHELLYLLHPCSRRRDCIGTMLFIATRPSLLHLTHVFVIGNAGAIIDRESDNLDADMDISR